ncbi:hypothetical protein M3Y97_01126500 [Aphelenchoides bicaudatus]|nr:hypothetical protein M3Y97_01126500 [Aphelenchoides bicaudatus]
MQMGLTGVYLVSQNHNPDTLKFVITIVLMLLFWESLYFVIVMRILQLLKPKIATFSPNTIRLHRQLTFLLLAQAISPLICLVTPVVLAALDRMIVDKCFGYPRIQASFLMSVAHMSISSMLTIGFVQPYRTKFKKAIVKAIVCLRIRVKASDQTRAAVISLSNNTQSQTI